MVRSRHPTFRVAGDDRGPVFLTEADRAGSASAASGVRSPRSPGLAARGRLGDCAGGRVEYQDEATARCSAAGRGLAAPVLYAGAQGELAGLDQVNVALPRALAGRGEVELGLTVDGKAANAVRVRFE